MCTELHLQQHFSYLAKKIRINQSTCRIDKLHHKKLYRVHLNMRAIRILVLIDIVVYNLDVHTTIIVNHDNEEQGRIQGWGEGTHPALPPKLENI